MADIDVKLLRSFLSVAAERSFSRAAERVGCSQPTISLRIQTLERILERRLFNRSYHEVTLTLAGKEMLPRAQAIIDQHDALLDSTTRGHVAGAVRLGLAEDYVFPVLPRALRVIETSFPGIEMSVATMLSGRLAHLVEARTLDLAVVTLPAGSGHPTVLATPQLIWVAAPDFTLSSEKPLPLALYPEGCVFRAAVLEALERAGTRHRETVTNASGEVIRSIVSAGSAVSAMAEGTLPPGLIRLSAPSMLPELPRIQIQLLERGDGLSKAARRVKALISNLLRSFA